MENNLEEYYSFYQKKSDTSIFESYFDLEKKLKENQSSENQLENNNRLAAIKKVIEERGLDIKLQQQINKKEKSNTAFDDYIKSGFKSLFIGVVLFVGGLLLMKYFEGNKILLIFVVIGGFKFLQGIIELAVGLFIRVNQANRF